MLHTSVLELSVIHSNTATTANLQHTLWGCLETAQPFPFWGHLSQKLPWGVPQLYSLINSW